MDGIARAFCRQEWLPKSEDIERHDSSGSRRAEIASESASISSRASPAVASGKAHQDREDLSWKAKAKRLMERDPSDT